MIDLEQIHSLTEFQRNAKKYVGRLKSSGKPEVLTVNGQAELVVQSADSYQQLLNDAEFVRSLRVIRKSLVEAKAGKGRPMRKLLEELAQRHGIELTQ
jgi:PHD/YefM family antitoxin component YafN of YafNO toxin-antitoxin module